MPQSLTPLAPTTAATPSADITVTGATTIFLYTADGLFPSDVQVPLMRKKGANYEPVCGEDGEPVFLTSRRREVTVYANGVYRTEKRETVFAVGTGTDT